MKSTECFDEISVWLGPALLLVSIGLLVVGVFCGGGLPVEHRAVMCLARMLLPVIPMLFGTYLTVYRWKHDEKLATPKYDEVLDLLKSVSSAATQISVERTDQASKEAQQRLWEILANTGSKIESLIEKRLVVDSPMLYKDFKKDTDKLDDDLRTLQVALGACGRLGVRVYAEYCVVIEKKPGAEEWLEDARRYPLPLAEGFDSLTTKLALAFTGYERDNPRSELRELITRKPTLPKSN